MAREFVESDNTEEKPEEDVENTKHDRDANMHNYRLICHFTDLWKSELSRTSFSAVVLSPFSSVMLGVTVGFQRVEKKGRSDQKKTWYPRFWTGKMLGSSPGQRWSGSLVSLTSESGVTRSQSEAWMRVRGGVAIVGMMKMVRVAGDRVEGLCMLS